MGFGRPTSKNAAQMLEPGGWPEVDESAFLNRASSLTDTLQQVTRTLESWLHEQTKISSWSTQIASHASMKRRTPSALQSSVRLLIVCLSQLTTVCAKPLIQTLTISGRKCRHTTGVTAIQRSVAEMAEMQIMSGHPSYCRERSAPAVPPVQLK